jgi:IS1 family transposase
MISRAVVSALLAAKGDQYVYIAMAGTQKAIISYRVGNRNDENTDAFQQDLRERIINAPEISSDAWPAYEGAVEQAFGSSCFVRPDYQDLCGRACEGRRAALQPRLRSSRTAA